MEEPHTEELSSRPRRTWKFYLSLLVALMAATWLAWKFRPLSSSERQLCGLWKAKEFQDSNRSDPYKPIYVFSNDRTFRTMSEMEIQIPSGERKIARMGGIGGTWKASNSTLMLRYQYPSEYDWDDPRERLFEIFFGDSHAESKLILFEKANAITLDGVEFEREKR